MPRDSSIIHRPEIAPINEATKLVREPRVIVRSDAVRAIRETRKTFETEPEGERPAR